ncbi:hypothetical protein L2E82_12831 [Cichorium intybus]|uniref:Uncharacterized protein n=1 Tax=Cichorium intybus TaxID=13427 RepID=A0ACB9GH57_CICIN|nr:hypothetical protein L2E82_12831 [Cichorium intybus]
MRGQCPYLYIRIMFSIKSLLPIIRKAKKVLKLQMFFFLSTDLLLYKGYRSVLSTTNFSETKFRYTYTCMYISAHTHIHGKLLNMQTRCWVQSVFWSMFRSF